MEESKHRHAEVEDRKTRIDARVEKGEKWAVGLYILHKEVLGNKATEVQQLTAPAKLYHAAEGCLMERPTTHEERTGIGMRYVA